jgi:CRP-like cAMP-binding protein
MIFNEGLPANRFYIILEGDVVLESGAGNNGGQLIQTVKAGETCSAGRGCPRRTSGILTRAR